MNRARARTLLIVSLALAGCGADGSPTGPGPMAQSALVGNWLSAGADVAPLLAKPPFNDTMITATFNADSTYTVLGVDNANKTTSFTGTYTATPSEVDGIFDITIAQNQPSTAAAQGIYQIDPATHRMKYEVVQTQPTNGITPPTASAGFGSTVYNGKKIDSLIQNFSRQ
ncbi:MAG TPA: hypothetical protein VFF06_23530 [Polyangia bacterium]|nr:hypothetical protein [Polyangia bacterium]